MSRAPAIQVAFVTAVIAGLALVEWHWGWPYTPDSGAYLETARNLLTGKGFLLAADGTSCEWWQPVALFPGGFAALTAVGALLSGVDVESTGPVMVFAAWLLLLPALGWALSPLLGRQWALVVGGLAVLSPGAHWMGVHMLSDMLFLLAVVAGFGCWLRGVPEGRLGWWFATGSLVGLAVWLRNAGIGVVAAYLLTFVLQAARGSVTSKAWWLQWGTFWLASALVYGPWLVRNLLVFGEIQPYSMPPSTIPLDTNLRILLQEWGAELFGHRIGRYVAWGWPEFLGAAALLAAVISAGIHKWHRRPAEKRDAAALWWLASYALLGSVLTVYARSIYEWGEPVGARHVAQLAWTLLALAAWAVSGTKRRGRRLVAGVVLTMLAARLFSAGAHVMDTVQMHEHVSEAGILQDRQPDGPIARAQRRRLCAAEIEHAGIAEQLGDNALLLSNDPSVFRVLGGFHVRALVPEQWSALRSCGRQMYVAALASRPFNASVLHNAEAPLLYNGRCLKLWEGG